MLIDMMAGEKVCGCATLILRMMDWLRSCGSTVPEAAKAKLTLSLLLPH